MTTITTTVRDRRIDVPAPGEIPDGTEVILTISERDESAPMTQDEIARTLAAMQRLQPWNIADDVTADLDDWENRLNQHGIDHRDQGMENVFR